MTFHAFLILDYAITKPVRIEKGKLQSTIQNFGPEYSVSFEFKIKSWRSNIWCSIIRVTSKAGNCCQHGQRYLALWTKRGSSDTIMFTASVATRGAYNVYHDPFKVNKWYRVVLSQKPIDGLLFYEIYVDDFLVSSIPNTSPMDPQEVKIYIGDRYHTAANGEVRNLYHVPGRYKLGKRSMFLTSVRILPV